MTFTSDTQVSETLHCTLNLETKALTTVAYTAAVGSGPPRICARSMGYHVLLMLSENHEVLSEINRRLKTAKFCRSLYLELNFN